MASCHMPLKFLLPRSRLTAAPDTLTALIKAGGRVGGREGGIGRDGGREISQAGRREPAGSAGSDGRKSHQFSQQSHQFQRQCHLLDGVQPLLGAHRLELPQPLAALHDVLVTLTGLDSLKYLLTVRTAELVVLRYYKPSH